MEATSPSETLVNFVPHTAMSYMAEDSNIQSLQGQPRTPKI